MRFSLKKFNWSAIGAILLSLSLTGSARDVIGPQLPPLLPVPPDPPPFLARAAVDLLGFLPETVATFDQGQKVTADFVRKSLVRDLAARIYEDRVPDSAGLHRLCLETVREKINQELVLQRAPAENISVTDPEIDAVIAQTREIYGNEGFLRMFLPSGKSLPELREELKQQILVHKWMWRQVQGAPAIPKSALKAYYDKHRAAFYPGGKPVPEGLGYIFLPAREARERAAARVEAEDILKQLKAGASFPHLAQEHSEGPAGLQRGKLDLFETGMLPPSVQEEAVKLPENEVSGVLETAGGFHLLKGGRQIPRTDTQTFDAIQFHILGELEKEKQTAHLEEVLKKLWETNHAVILIPDVSK